MSQPCPHCNEVHEEGVLFCPNTGMAISVSLLQPGTIIDDKYEVVRRLAAGGMGAVYEVIHRRIGRHLAMKLILPELAANEEVARRFEIEARAASAIGHENIVEITDMGTTADEQPFLVMELLEGHDLGSVLDRGDSLSIDRTRHLMAQILSALDAAHDRGIVHRDLKPENIFLVEREGNPDFVKLLDFGISKFADDDDNQLHLTQTGLIMGTPYYMSPEQARGERHLDHRSDLFAAGGILYQMLTGARPFEAENLNQVLYQVSNAQYPPPRSLRPAIPERLERVVRKALARDPEQRFQSAKEFRKALIGRTRVETVDLPVETPLSDSQDVPAAYVPTLAAVTGTPEGRPRTPRMVFAAVGAVMALTVGAALWLAQPGDVRRASARGLDVPMAGAAAERALMVAGSAMAPPRRVIEPSVSPPQMASPRPAAEKVASPATRTRPRRRMVRRPTPTMKAQPKNKAAVKTTVSNQTPAAPKVKRVQPKRARKIHVLEDI